MPQSGLRLRPESVAVWPCLAVGAIGAAALAYNANAVWLLLCLIVAAVFGGGARTCQRLRSINVTVPPIPAISAESDATVAISVEVPSAVSGLTVSAGGEATALHGSGAQRVLVEWPARRRGIYPLGRIRVGTAYPMGVLRCEWHVHIDSDVVVAPRPQGLPLRPADAAHGDGAGGQIASDFAGHSPYRAGDPIAGIDWRAAARGQGWLSARWDGRGGGATHLAWTDCVGDVETRLSQLALWVGEADRQGLRFSLILPNECIGPDAGTQHRERCLRALAVFPSAPPVPSA